MAKKSFVPDSEDGKASWFKNFANKLGGYAAKYSIGATELADVTASELSFDYWFQFAKQNREYALKVTAYKNEVRDGVPAGAEPSVQPTPPPTGPVPPATAPGGYLRAIALGNSIKAKKNYTVADGQDLGLEGAEITTADPSTFKPVLSVVTGNNGKPDIKWKKQAGTNGIHIYMKVTGGSATAPIPAMSPSPSPAVPGFVFIGTDTQPDFIDNTPLPPEGQTQQRIYKAIYFLNDQNVGQFSEEVKITVTGTI